MKRYIVAVALLTIGYLAGTLAPRASAGDGAAGIVQELRGIKGEIEDIRRILEKAHR